ncbi:MAG: PLP-dependent aminotransferase family protein, partial [Tepidisphaeraceae bacterium]
GSHLNHPPRADSIRIAMQHPQPSPSPAAAPPLSLSSKARRTREQPISFLINAAMANPNLINFAAGLVDPQTLPVEKSLEITRTILSDTSRGRAALQYDTTLGLAELRKTALKHLEALEGKPASAMGVTAQDIVVTTGSQQALYLVGETLVDPGDIVIAANPSYFVYTGTLWSFGAKVMTVPMDENGMDVDAVERLLNHLEAEGKLPRVRVIYCTSYYQNPTGLTLSLERRPRLLELARRFSHGHRILILEDAAYRELSYEGPALPSIKSFDPDNRYTVLASTFSKPFAPGIKTGYTAMPSDLLHEVLQQKGNHDFGSAALSQHIALEAMRSGAYAKQVEHLKNGYRSKRDTLLSALAKYMPKSAGISWTHPNGGLYVWLTLPEQVNTSRGAMFDKAVEHGVLYVPGDYCFQPDESGFIPKNHIRLSFGQVAGDQIERGIERLASVVSGQLSAAKSAHSPSPRTRGEGRGEGAEQTRASNPKVASLRGQAPLPHPLPGYGERE